jgi:hypothetical protein
MKGRSHWVRGLLPGLLFVVTASCAAPAAKEDATEGLAPYVVPRVPESAKRTFVDFGGKLHLVGYEIEPEGKVGPGQSLTLKLYWKVVGRLGPNWNLFTHLEGERGEQLWNYDREGAFRGFVSGKMPAGLSLLSPGVVYVDEQTLALPKPEQLTPRVAVVIGVWNDRLRLPVVSGVSNGRDAAIVTHFDTGLERPKAVAKAARAKRP